MSSGLPRDCKAVRGAQKWTFIIECISTIAMVAGLGYSLVGDLLWKHGVASMAFFGVPIGVILVKCIRRLLKNDEKEYYKKIRNAKISIEGNCTVGLALPVVSCLCLCILYVFPKLASKIQGIFDFFGGEDEGGINLINSLEKMSTPTARTYNIGIWICVLCVIVTCGLHIWARCQMNLSDRQKQYANARTAAGFIEVAGWLFVLIAVYRCVTVMGTVIALTDNGDSIPYLICLLLLLRVFFQVCELPNKVILINPCSNSIFDIIMAVITAGVPCFFYVRMYQDELLAALLGSEWMLCIGLSILGVAVVIGAMVYTRQKCNPLVRDYGDEIAGIFVGLGHGEEVPEERTREYDILLTCPGERNLIITQMGENKMAVLRVLVKQVGVALTDAGEKMNEMKSTGNPVSFDINIADEMLEGLKALLEKEGATVQIVEKGRPEEAFENLPAPAEAAAGPDISGAAPLAPLTTEQAERKEDAGHTREQLKEELKQQLRDELKEEILEELLEEMKKDRTE